MRQPITISHKLHPARRQGSTLRMITFCLATNKSLAMGTANVDALYDKLSLEFPEAKLSKHKGYVLVEKSDE